MQRHIQHIWFKEKGLHRLSDAIALFARCVDIAETLKCPWLIENPVSTISSYWRKPDHTFHPWEYGDAYTKKTCLWVGNGFVMPEQTPVFPTEGSKMHKLPPSNHRADLRSVTPSGFAQAVFEANHDKISPSLLYGMILHPAVIKEREQDF